MAAEAADKKVKAVIEDAKTICGLLASRKSEISGEEEELSRIADHERLLVKEGLAHWVTLSAWRGEPLLVWKPDGSTRYTGDYRKANRSITMESYPTTSLQEEIRKMAHGKVFSVTTTRPVSGKFR